MNSAATIRATFYFFTIILHTSLRHFISAPSSCTHCSGAIYRAKLITAQLPGCALNGAATTRIMSVEEA
ncbi:hypothetical protein [Pantoea dispersa]|uniref:Secreted protein n=1 Tax=Pantoea dispersa TaxID=59814 RepID=A0ABY2ZVS1_9GAMM|nr:hypothetical protein [Pantoea dispersa]TQC71340.1 hypothetical protein FK492_16325 [Pantoea dispersa]